MLGENEGGTTITLVDSKGPYRFIAYLFVIFHLPLLEMRCKPIKYKYF